MKHKGDYHSNGKVSIENKSDKSIKEEKNKRKKEKRNKWVYIIFAITFILSLIFGVVSNIVIGNLNIFVAIVILVLIIAVGIAFDMIGMSVVCCNEATFHSMAAKKQKGAKEAIRLVKYSEKVSSVCNDVIGDVCGVISGGVSAMLAVRISQSFNINSMIISLLLGALVASFTVFGKAIGKSISARKADSIIYNVGKVIYILFPVKKKRRKEKIK